MQLDIDIRKINEDSLDDVLALANAIWPATYKAILGDEQIHYMMNLMYSRSQLLQQMTEKGHQFLILTYKGRAAGFASYSKTSETGIYKLHKIYLQLNLHGMGLGKAMIDYIVNDIKSAGAKALELNVNRNNKACYFYEKLGFSIVRQEDLDIGNGYFMNDYVMSMRLIS